VPDVAALDALRDLRRRLDRARVLPMLAANSTAPPRLGLLASGRDPALLASALADADGVLLEEATAASAESLAAQAGDSGKALWLGVRVGEDDDAATAISRLLRAREAAAKEGYPCSVLALSATSDATLIQAGRLLVAELARIGADDPLFLRSEPAAEHLLSAALPIGSLICDGLGDAVQAATLGGGQEEVRLSLDVLQAAGTRLSKTDYVACPSCGRTLFDLQSTTERIKAKTSHLVGVRIAIMGCVVNGPGEMADADFGYMGGSPGHVNLYVGKECVERGVPEAEADTRLIELLRAHGRWIEPGVDDE
jgi:4-hydroxy-3-methylbut-2-en-1-yl diphosphate synthase IspG/GcpE